MMTWIEVAFSFAILRSAYVNYVCEALKYMKMIPSSQYAVDQNFLVMFPLRLHTPNTDVPNTLTVTW